jgi:uncharacterized Tic20 family protein
MENTNKFISKFLSKWSVEFSCLLSVLFSLSSLNLIDNLVIEIILTVSMIMFFIGILDKFILSVYKQHLGIIKDIKEYKEVKKTLQ